MTRARTTRARWTRSASCRRLRRITSAAHLKTSRSAASVCTVSGAPGRGMTYAEAAKRAVELGGRCDGHEVPEDINRDDEAIGGGASPVSG